MKKQKTEIEPARPTIRMSPDELRKLRIFCLENYITFQDFGMNALEYCMKNKILPGKK